jgi:hypothetical protein
MLDNESQRTAQAGNAMSENANAARYVPLFKCDGTISDLNLFFMIFIFISAILA